MHKRLARLSSLLGGPILALLISGIVLGYSGELAATVEVSAPASAAACGSPFTVTALIQDIDGKPIEGQPVTWSFVSGNVAGDSILDTTTTTDANGIATTQVQFASSPHTVTINAVADAASGQAVVVVSCQGLPRTDTAPESSFAVMALAALAVAIGFGTILRRFAADRR